MNNQIVYHLFYGFVNRGFSALRFNFRGVGRSQGAFDRGGRAVRRRGRARWPQSVNPDARNCWIAGVSFGAWIGMQLLMRRPEIEGFISIAAPANRFDFTFLAPCPSSGLFVRLRGPGRAGQGRHGGDREGEDPEGHPDPEHQVVDGANHFFDGKVEDLMTTVDRYLDKKIGKVEAAA